MVFWKCWQDGLVETKINEKCRTIKFKLKIPYSQLSGIMNLREEFLAHNLQPSMGWRLGCREKK